MADEQPSEMLELPPESYTVVWICAIPCELTAARELLDACHEQLESQAKHDENNYILGRMGKHNVAIACLPEYGTNRAAIAAKSMQSTFPNLRFGVLVGVGGGVPSAQNDIRLGDIAVSLPSGQDGGVIQYDLGRREVDGFHRRGTLNKPPTLLRTAITNLRAIRKLPQEISNLVNEVFGGDEDSEEEWTYPSNSKDILFKPAHKHVNKNPDCDACVRDPTGIVTWDPRRGTNPRIHYGNIGSGNAVIKDALERDFLAGRDSILCFEMEAAGLMDDFPCVVIRGICDYADSHKNKKWQPYAAAIAAAYAKKLLSVISPQAVDNLSPIGTMPYRKRPQMNALHVSAFNGHDVVISKLSTDGKSVINERDSTGANALQWASLRGHFKSVQRLLEKGAEVNAQGGRYGNALQAASFEGHIEIVQILLERGAEVNAQGGEYGNALQAASYRGHVEVVQRLLERGAEVNAQGGEYGNALQAASYRGHVEVVQRLLERGAEVNAQGGFYGNALQAASSGGHIEIVQRLLEKGAEVNAQGGDYGNALLAASSGGHVDVVQVLQKYVSTN
uniref:Ankyrin repeat domain-containing protein 50 n=1 Tax=Talaromyces marneffei PM1 TaxID=1077442 RepID=A0A093V869_TALMA